VEIMDATLMLLIESGAYPAVAALAQCAYDRLAEGDRVDYRLLNDLIGEASGKGVLRAIHRKYGPAAHEAILMPILQEIGRQAPIRSRGYPRTSDEDPLTAATWPPS
jgi:hypothetical protein